jgi:hypothetical protein
MVSYLETDKYENVCFYRKFGFDIIAEAEVLEVPTWFMSRPSVSLFPGFKDDVFPSKLRICDVEQSPTVPSASAQPKVARSTPGGRGIGVSSCTIEPSSGKLFCRSARLMPE